MIMHLTMMRTRNRANDVALKQAASHDIIIQKEALPMDTVQTSDERTCAALELLRMLEEADENVRAGYIAPMENTFSALRDSLLQRKQQ